MSLPPVVAGGVGKSWRIGPAPPFFIYNLQFNCFTYFLFKTREGEHLRSNKY